MQHKPFFFPIIKQALQSAWQKKSWWPIGFLGLFLSSALGFQFILQGLNSLSKPDQWWYRWKTISETVSIGQLMQGQFSLLLSNTKDWFALVFGWSMVLLLIAALVFISCYAITTLIAAIKIQHQEQVLLLRWSIRHAFKYSAKVFWVIILLQIISSLILVTFSVPIVWLGILKTGFWISAIGITLLFMVFLVFSFIIAAVSFYTVQYIIMEDMGILEAIALAWVLFKNYWLITFEMFLIQIFVAIVFSLILVVLTSLVIIPLVVIGVILVTYQFYDITTFLQPLTLMVALLFTGILGSVFTIFQFFSWSLLFIKLEVEDPGSRMIHFTENRIVKKLF